MLGLKENITYIVLNHFVYVNYTECQKKLHTFEYFTYFWNKSVRTFDINTIFTNNIMCTKTNFQLQPAEYTFSFSFVVLGMLFKITELIIFMWVYCWWNVWHFSSPNDPTLELCILEYICTRYVKCWSI